jgi:hypothetical protein
MGATDTADKTFVCQPKRGIPCIKSILNSPRWSIEQQALLGRGAFPFRHQV